MPCMDSVFSVSSDTSFGDFSLSCSFSSVEEHRQTLEGEESEEEIVEPYKFEPQASKSLVDLGLLLLAPKVMATH